MATHNQVRVVGFILNDPTILHEGEVGAEIFVAQIRTVRRDIEGLNDDRFADIVIMYDEPEKMEKYKRFKKFDVLDIKGVLNIMPTPKTHTCSHCGYDNTKYNSLSTFIYPISTHKLGSYKDFYDNVNIMPNKILEDNYMEVSNQCLIIGTVVSEPELIETTHGRICRYCLGVNRKYYIKTQDNAIADYPWVYSYGRQAERDYVHLIDKETTVLVDGFIQNKKVKGIITCENCNKDFTYTDIGTQFVPYSVEYLSGYKTDLEIENESKLGYTPE